MKTAQEILDKVSDHLLTQMQKSRNITDNIGTCAYRSKGGLKCAIGCLIPDTEYSSEIEGIGISNLFHSGNYCPPSLRELQSHEQLLTDLQEVHDGAEPEEWPGELRDLADEFGLNFER